MGFKVAPSESTITQPTNYEIKTEENRLASAYQWHMDCNTKIRES